jgi:hypothetical protein
MGPASKQSRSNIALPDPLAFYIVGKTILIGHQVGHDMFDAIKRFDNILFASFGGNICCRNRTQVYSVLPDKLKIFRSKSDTGLFFSFQLRHLP